MTLYKFFKAKQKLRRKDAHRLSTTDLDTSGILAPPFPPLLSRAKSPSDILDFVGYPRLQVRKHPSPLPIKQVPSTTNAPLTIRNKTPPSTATTATRIEQVAQSLPPKAAVQTKTTTTTTTTTAAAAAPPLTSSPLPRDIFDVHMPRPKKAMAPTWRILNSDQVEKTLIAEDPEKPVKSSGNIIHVNLLQQQVMDFERERLAWARREEEHRQVEQQMLQRIQDNQAKIDQLSNLSQKRQSTSSNDRHQRSNRTSFESFTSHQQSTPSYIDDNDDDDDEDDGEYSTFDADYDAYHSYDTCQPNDTHLGQPYHQNQMNNGDNRLLLFAPMHPAQYQRIQRYTRYNHSTHDDDDDDERSDDGYQPSSTYARQHLPYLEGSEYGDDEDEDDDDDQDEALLDDDDGYLNRGPWRYSQPKMLYGDYWAHPPPPPGRRRRRSSIQQQQRAMVYYSSPSHSIYYQQQQRPTSAHALQEHQCKPLRRHHSFGSDPNQAYYQHHVYRRSYRV